MSGRLYRLRWQRTTTAGILWTARGKGDVVYRVWKSDISDDWRANVTGHGVTIPVVSRRRNTGWSGSGLARRACEAWET